MAKINKDDIINNINKIIAELEKGNDITIKKSRDGIRILSLQVKKINK
jgi:hypothetical protein